MLMAERTGQTEGGSSLAPTQYSERLGRCPPPLHHYRNACCLVSHSTGIAKEAAPSASPTKSFVAALAIHRHLRICLDGIAGTESMLLPDLAFMCFAAAYSQLCSNECCIFVPNRPRKAKQPSPWDHTSDIETLQNR